MKYTTLGQTCWSDPAADGELSASPKGLRHPTGLRPTGCLVPQEAKNPTTAGNNFAIAPDYGREAPGQRARIRRVKCFSCVRVYVNWFAST